MNRLLLKSTKKCGIGFNIVYFCELRVTRLSKIDVFTTSKNDEDEEVTHVLSVAMRQRQIPSRERKFLCLKPGSNLSQMYWIKEKHELGEIEKKKKKRSSVVTGI